MGQSCNKPEEEDASLELTAGVSLQALPLPARRRPKKTLHTDSSEALQADTNPFKEDLQCASSDERGPASGSSCPPAGAPVKDVAATKPSVAGGGASGGVVVLAPVEGRSSVQALAFPYADAPSLGEILGGERAELLSECGAFLQVRWNGLRVWVAREDALGAPEERGQGGSPAPPEDAEPAPEEDPAGRDAAAAWFVGQDVELRAQDWIPARITGILGSGLVQVRSLASSSQAAEDGVEAQCGVWLDREQQRELLRPSGSPARRRSGAASAGANALAEGP